MRRQLIAAQAARFENDQLKRLLRIPSDDRPAITSGRIVGSSFASSRRLATLSAGSSSGVRIGQPVRAPDGLLGRILETGRFASRVLLVSDRSNVVPVRMLRGGIAAISTGRGDGTVELKPLQVGQNPFRPGDIVVTSGTGGIYAPNVPVAYVVKLADDGAIARPLADPAAAPFGSRRTDLRARRRRPSGRPRHRHRGRRPGLMRRTTLAGSSSYGDTGPLRSQVTPIASTLFASALALLPIVSGAQLLPNFGLLALLSWRLLRPKCGRRASELRWASRTILSPADLWALP
jgi:hypothetical protein